MPGDPTLDPDFMKAAPHEQMAYLTQTDRDFAKASPQDQMGYLMHIRGLSPTIAQPGGNVAAERAANDPKYSLLGDRPDQFPVNEGRKPLSNSIPGSFEGSYSSNDQEYGKFMTGAGVATGVALGAASAAPYVAPIAKAGLKLVQAHPIASMAAIEAAKQLPGMAGKIAGKIPSWLPLLAGNPEAEAGPSPTPPVRWNPEAEAAPSASVPPVKWNPQTQQPELTAAPPPVRWPQAMEPQQTATAPPPLRWADKEPAQALEDIKTAAAESPYQVQTVSVQGVKVPVGTNASIPPMQSVQSTTIQAHGYNPATQEMFVQFKNGKTYRYSGVPQKVFDQYKSAESQGSFHADNVKGRYKTDVVDRGKPTPGQQVKDALSGGQQ